MAIADIGEDLVPVRAAVIRQRLECRKRIQTILSRQFLLMDIKP